MASFSTPLNLQVNIDNLLLVEEDIHWEFDGDYNIYNALWTFVKVTFTNIETTSISKKNCRMVKIWLSINLP